MIKDYHRSTYRKPPSNDAVAIISLAVGVGIGIALAMSWGLV